MTKPVILSDSSLDLNESLASRVEVKKVAFPINVGDKEYLDDGSIDIPEFLKQIAATPTVAKTAAPSPGGFMEAFGDAVEGFIITISGKLSACYSNACLAARELMAEGNRKVHVFDSMSASVGETAIADRVAGWIAEGLSFDEIVRRGEEFLQSMKTYFVLEDLSTLVKAGRIPKLAGKFVQRLSIIPVCEGVQGEIKICQVKRGMKSALKQLASIIGKEAKNAEEKTLYISHVMCEERAEEFRDLVMSLVPFKNCEIIATGGLSTTYANDGGIIVAF